MFRFLFVTFFMVTSAVLYVDGTSSNDSKDTPSIMHISLDKETASQTQTKPSTGLGRRYKDKDQIATLLKRQNDTKRNTYKRYVVANSGSFFPNQKVDRVKKVKTVQRNSPLNASNKYRIATLIKAELKRIGCYRGTISGSWNKNVLKSLAHYNVSTTQNLSSVTPTLQTLAVLKNHGSRSCKRRYRMVKKVRKIPLLTLAHLPEGRPKLPDQTAQIIPSSSGVPYPVVSSYAKKENDVITTLSPTAPVTQAKIRKPRKKKKYIASYGNDDYQNKGRFFTSNRRPQASLVGIRKKRPSYKKRTVKRNPRLRRAKARYKKRRKARARKRYRSARRRYYRKKRNFGFSHGQLGYW